MNTDEDLLKGRRNSHNINTETEQYAQSRLTKEELETRLSPEVGKLMNNALEGQSEKYDQVFMTMLFAGNSSSQQGLIIEDGTSQKDQARFMYASAAVVDNAYLHQGNTYMTTDTFRHRQELEVQARAQIEARKLAIEMYNQDRSLDLSVLLKMVEVAPLVRTEISRSAHEDPAMAGESKKVSGFITAYGAGQAIGQAQR